MKNDPALCDQPCLQPILTVPIVHQGHSYCTDLEIRLIKSIWSHIAFFCQHFGKDVQFIVLTHYKLHCFIILVT